jgi:hypothetical protein
MNIKITVTIPPGVPSKHWHRVASKLAGEAVQEANLDWKEAEVIVNLPERGRSFRKSAGYVSLGAHG